MKIIASDGKFEDLISNNIGEIVFSAWVKWEERKTIHDSNNPGVYMLGKFSKIPKGPAHHLNKNVVYIGETCGQTLQKRWYQFNKSAFRSESGHSGGWTYNSFYKDAGSDLFVAGFPVIDISETLRDSFIRYLERRLLLDFVLKFKDRPNLNKK